MRLSDMQNIKTNVTLVVFWGLVIALISAISTTIFSESPFHDIFGFSLMAVAILGLCLNIPQLLINTIFKICNP